MCDYCTPYSDGYVKRLPKRRPGYNFAIFSDPEGYYIKVTGDTKNPKIKIPINFCPQCGRKLQPILLVIIHEQNLLNAVNISAVL